MYVHVMKQAFRSPNLSGIPQLAHQEALQIEGPPDGIHRTDICLAGASGLTFRERSLLFIIFLRARHAKHRDGTECPLLALVLCSQAGITSCYCIRDIAQL